MSKIPYIKNDYSKITLERASQLKSLLSCWGGYVEFKDETNHDDVRPIAMPIVFEEPSCFYIKEAWIVGDDIKVSGSTEKGEECELNIHDLDEAGINDVYETVYNMYRELH